MAPARHATHTTLAASCIALAFLALSFAARPARAGRAPHHLDETVGWSASRTARAALVEVQVQVDGERVPLYREAAGHRHYFEAAPGRKYALRIRNRTGRRIGVLVAVDGLNIVSGRRSSLAPHEPMYVLGPGERTTLRGWRTSLDDVRSFVFVDENRSYASRTDQASGDMGWIRILAFEEEWPAALRCPTPEGVRDDAQEKVFDATRDERAQNDRAPRGAADEVLPAPSESASRKGVPEPGRGLPLADSPGTLKAHPENRVNGKRQSAESFPGTGWGDRRRDRVRAVEFEPASHATDQVVLRYEYARGLVALGILPDPSRLSERDRGECRFAQPPLW